MGIILWLIIIPTWVRAFVLLVPSKTTGIGFIKSNPIIYIDGKVDQDDYNIIIGIVYI